MDFFKLISRYIIMTIFVGMIHYLKLTFFGIVILKTICFIVLCLFLDVFALKYCEIRYYDKVDEKINETNKLSLGVIAKILINYCTYIFCLWLTINGQYSNYPDLNFLQVVINYAYSVPLSLLSSMIFYYVHRFMHSKFLYRNVHKQHHIYNHPSSFVGLYTSFVEFIFSNCASFYIPHIIINPHPYFIYSYTFIGLCDVFINHTSYHFNNHKLNVLFGGSHFHYIHHSKYKYNFGLNNKIFDNLHKTLDLTSVNDYEIY